eukprot:389396_1
MAKAAIRKLHVPNAEMLNNIKFHNNQLFSPNIDYPDDDERQCDINMYPMLQFYDLNTDPISTKIFKSSKHTFLFMNINGSAYYNLAQQNPMMLHLIPKYQPHTIAIADHRLQQEPNWTIPGYTPKLFTKGDQKTAGNIGGIWIFVKNTTRSK